jgi:hypothetical protein
MLHWPLATSMLLPHLLLLLQCVSLLRLLLLHLKPVMPLLLPSSLSKLLAACGPA